MKREQSGTVAERLGGTLQRGAKPEIIFGHPVDRRDATVIPVGKVRLFFGGGGGWDDSAKVEGGGGGGGITATPLGYIQLSRGRTVFKRIRSSSSLVMFGIAVGVGLGVWVSRILR